MSASRPKSHLKERPLFTQRYGLAKWHDPWRIPGYEPPEWAMRHNSARVDAMARPHHWCRCPGCSLAEWPCAQKVTQEDGLCDECREWCVAVDPAGVFHLIADLEPVGSRGDTEPE